MVPLLVLQTHLKFQLTKNSNKNMMTKEMELFTIPVLEMPSKKLVAQNSQPTKNSSKVIPQVGLFFWCDQKFLKN